MARKTKSTSNTISVGFASIAPRVESRIVAPTERKNGTHDYIEWGDGNRYPQYLLSLYKSVASLRAVIDGSTDFVVGDSITSEVPLLMGAVNDEGMTITEVVKCMARDYFIYGGYALEIGRNAFGEVASIRPLDYAKLRTTKRNDIIFYSDEWSGWRKKCAQYQRFNPAHKAIEQSVVYEKNTHYQTYAEPLYVASLLSCEVEKAIDEYHLNAINNNFAGSYIVNFNNGQPDAERMREIEEQFTEKFSGKENAGRILFSWNRGSDNATTLQKLEVDDFGDRYSALAKHCRQQIYTAFRINPNLVGIPTDNLGFNNEEYSKSFRLYNRTQIRPVQAMIVDTFDKIFGVKGAIEIQPFSIDDTAEEAVE